MRVKEGFTFPVGDLIYRVTSIQNTAHESYIDVTAQPIDVDDFVPTADCLALPSMSTTDLEGARFDVELGDGKDFGLCKFVVQPKAPEIRSRPERPLPGSTFFSLQTGDRVRLTPTLELELVRLVPLNEKLRFGGWAEFRPILNRESAKDE